MNKKKKGKPSKPGSPAWMTTWADLVSLLMCFFVLLFSLSSVDEARFQEFAEAMAGRRVFLSGALGTIFNDSSGIMEAQSPPVPLRMDPEAPEVEDIDDIQDLISARIGQMEALAETFRTYMAPYDDDVLAEIGITVSELGEYLMIDFPSGMLFDSGQDVLLPAAIEMIDHVAATLVDFPGHRVEVHGHTDNVPINTIQFRSNFHLSAGRAIAVLDHLINVHNIDPWMLSAVGMGEYRPIDTNDTAEGRARNRRVEIFVFAQQQSLTVITD